MTGFMGIDSYKSLTEMASNARDEVIVKAIWPENVKG